MALTEEELRRYAGIGLRADVNNKAAAVLQNVERLKVEMNKGGTVRSRFKSAIDDTIEALVAFDEALSKKEAGQ